MMSFDLPSWIPRSTFGLVMAGLYGLTAVTTVTLERQNTSGGWITLRGMGTYLVTLPVSGIGEWLGHRFDYRRNFDMIVAVGTCTVMVYFVSAGVVKLGSLLFSGARAS